MLDSKYNGNEKLIDLFECEQEVRDLDRLKD